MTVKIKDVTDGFIKEIEALKAERDELAAKLVSIQDAALKPRGRTRQQWIDNIKRCALEVSARECLRDVRAEAGRVGFFEGYVYALGSVDEIDIDHANCHANEYAAKVRQGAA